MIDLPRSALEIWKVAIMATIILFLGIRLVIAIERLVIRFATRIAD